LKILLNITHGFQARLLLRSGIGERLLDLGCDLVVLTPNADEEYMASEFAEPAISLVQMPERYSRIEKAVVSTRQYVLMNPSLGATLQYKHERFKKAYPTRARVTRGINLVLGHIPMLRRLYLRGEAALFAGREFEPILEEQRPDLVVAGTPGFDFRDAHLLRAARRLGIPSATVMMSWDNLTSKGYMGAQPDHLLVWSSLMADEAVRYHNFSGTITEVGAAQFDVYPQARASVDVEAFKRSHGVPNGRSLVVWGTINNDIYPNQLDLLRQFARELSGHADKYLWVRIHPQTVSGPHQALTDQYLALACDRVKVEVPPVRSERLRWDVPKEDAWHLASLMMAADVVITPQSTLTIDAACAGTPVINLAIDDDFALTFKYTHYQNVLKHDGAWVVRSMEGLIEAVERSIAEPSLRREGREAIVAEQFGSWYGHASRRVADVLAELALRGSAKTGLPKAADAAASG
jgi:hypothetical protein